MTRDRAGFRTPRSRGAGVAAAVLLAVLCLTPPPACGVTADDLVALGPDGDVVVPPFGVGERLVFQIKYGFVSAGTAIMSIPELVSERGYLCYHIVSVAESSPWFAAFFEVRDSVESLLDVRHLVSRRFEKRVREGDFRSHDVVIFDHERHVAVYPEKKGRAIPMPLDAQDILSSLYYVRMMDLEVGRSVYIENHADRKNYPLEIKVLKRERVEVPAGEFDCLVVEPIMRASGIFRSEGRLTVWLTDDEYKIPVLMKSKVVIGSVSAMLAELGRAPGR
jgi:hypothetical protein